MNDKIKIDVKNDQVNEIISFLLKMEIRAKLVLNFDGKGGVTPELTVNNESLCKLLLDKI